MAFIATAESIAALGLTRVKPRGLSEKHFWMMMGAAAAVHLLVLLAIEYWPREQITEIPIRTLNLKLGGGQTWNKLDALAEKPVKPVKKEPVAAPKPVPRPAMATPSIKAPAPVSKPEATSFSAHQFDRLPAPKPVEQPRHVKAEAVRQRPALNPVSATQPPKAATTIPTGIKLDEVKLRRAENLKPLPALTGLEAVALAKAPPSSAPVRHVREIPTPQAAPLPPAAGYAEGSAEAKAIRARYEQQLSLWLEKHKIYPAAAKMLGQHGQPVVRIRMDRAGNVKFSSIDTSSGYRLIDDAAMDMVKRANPFPPPPANYPGDKLLEFIVPVAFKLN